MSQRKIAARLGISVNSVWGFIKKHKTEPQLPQVSDSNPLATNLNSVQKRDTANQSTAEDTVDRDGKGTRFVLESALRRAAEMSLNVEDYGELTVGLDRLSRAGKVLHRYGETQGPSKIQVAVEISFPDSSPAPASERIQIVDVES